MWNRAQGEASLALSLCITGFGAVWSILHEISDRSLRVAILHDDGSYDDRIGGASWDASEQDVEGDEGRDPGEKDSWSWACENTQCQYQHQHHQHKNDSMITERQSQVARHREARMQARGKQRMLVLTSFKLGHNVSSGGGGHCREQHGKEEELHS